MAKSVRGKGGSDLAVALASGASVAQAATRCGVSERTVYRRLEDPDFRQQVDRLRAQMVGRAVGKINNNMARAADKLRRLLESKNESVALSAARTILEAGQRLREHSDMEQRLTKLEEALRRQEGRR